MILCFTGFIEYLPFLWLLSMPVYGSFYGVDVVVQYFIQMATVISITSCLPRQLNFLSTFLQTSVFGILISTSLLSPPSFILWMVGKLLTWTEPLLLVGEASGAILLFMSISIFLSEKIDDNPRMFKMLILGLAGACYVTVSVALIALFTSPNIVWCTVLLLTVLCTTHLSMWWSEDGIITDAAFITLCSAILLNVKEQENYYLTQPLEIPDTWNTFHNISYLTIFKEAIRGSATNTAKAMMFLRKVMSPVYVSMMAVRVCGVLSLYSSFCQRDPEEKDNSALETGSHRWQFGVSELSFKLLLMAVYTQTIVHHVTSFASDRRYQQPTEEWWFTLDLFLPGRIAQIFIMLLTYLFILYKKSEE